MPFPKGHSGKGGGGKSAAVALRSEHACSLCHSDLDFDDPRGYIKGTCSVCGSHSFHFDCVADHVEKSVKLTNSNSRCMEKGRNIARNRPQDLLAQNRTVQRKPQRCTDATCTGLMVEAELIKPQKPAAAAALEPALPPPPPTRAQEPPAAKPKQSVAPKQPPQQPAIVKLVSVPDKKPAALARSSSAGGGAAPLSRSSSSSSTAVAATRQSTPSAAVHVSSREGWAAAKAAKEAAAKQEKQRHMEQLRAAAAAARATLSGPPTPSCPASIAASTARTSAGDNAGASSDRRGVFARARRLSFPSGERPKELQMCMYWEAGRPCSWLDAGDCPFCHGPAELAAREDEWEASGRIALPSSGSVHSVGSRGGGSVSDGWPALAAATPARPTEQQQGQRVEPAAGLAPEPPAWGEEATPADEAHTPPVDGPAPLGSTDPWPTLELCPSDDEAMRAAIMLSLEETSGHIAAAAAPAVPSLANSDSSPGGGGAAAWGSSTGSGTAAEGSAVATPATTALTAGRSGALGTAGAAAAAALLAPEPTDAEADGVFGAGYAAGLAAALRLQQEHLQQQLREHGAQAAWAQPSPAPAAQQHAPPPAPEAPAEPAQVAAPWQQELWHQEPWQQAGEVSSVSEQQPAWDQHQGQWLAHGGAGAGQPAGQDWHQAGQQSGGDDAEVDELLGMLGIAA